MASTSSWLSHMFQAVNISKQKSVPFPVPEGMGSTLQSYPPLGQATSALSPNLTFTAVLEIPKSREAEPWEVSIWLSVDGSEWNQVQLFPIEVGQTPQTLQSPPDSMSRLYFASPLSFDASVQFTLRFRATPDKDWTWIRDEQGLDDGWILRPSSIAPSDKLSHLIANLNVKDWKISPCLSQSPRTNIWALEAPIPAGYGDTSAYRDISIGIPWGSILRWFAIVRQSTPWLAPRHGKCHFSLDKDAILCSFMSPQGRNLVFLAVSGINHVLPLLRHTSNNGTSIHARNDGVSEEKATVLVSESDSFELAVAAVMYHARTLVSKARQTSPPPSEEPEALSGDIKPEWIENWYDGLGFCTWNALGQKLTDQKIFDAVDKLAQHNIKISSLIIDDNWQSIDHQGHDQFQHGWKEFEADAKAFPKGLKATVSHIRQKHPHIQHIAVWHALLGYWGGLAPDGQLAQAYKTVRVAREDVDPPIGGEMTVVAEEDVSRFYNDFYRFLSDCGVDAVKTDAQFMMDSWTSASARRALLMRYLNTWTISMLRHFSARAISCMSQMPQALFHSQMPSNRPAIVVRNSNDFFPNVPSSHPWHVWTNAYNNIFTQYLNVLPDWDMFQTVHEYSGFHAAARCISGGPIYITDVPGEHNMDLIGQMTGVTPRGRTVILRPSVVGKSVHPYVGYEDGVLLKVGGYHGASQTGNPMLAIFNVSARPLTELIPLSIFPGTDPSVEYVVRAHTTGNMSSPTKVGDPNSLITGALPVGGNEIFCASPLTTVSGTKHGTTQVANLGLLSKMTGAAAIAANQVKQAENGRVEIDTRIKAFGVLGLYLSSLPSMTIEGDFLATIQGQAIPRHTVSISTVDEHVLEIDIGTAWDEMGLKSWWSNDVEIKIYFSS